MHENVWHDIEVRIQTGPMSENTQINIQLRPIIYIHDEQEQRSVYIHAVEMNIFTIIHFFFQLLFYGSPHVYVTKWSAPSMSFNNQLV